MSPAKVSGYKINTQIDCISLYQHTCGHRDLKCKYDLFTIAQKILRYKSNKALQDSYTENYKMLMKEIKEDINKWGHILCSWIGRFKSKNANSPQ